MPLTKASAYNLMDIRRVQLVANFHNFKKASSPSFLAVLMGVFLHFLALTAGAIP